jgi:hypothetical protein
MRGLVYIELRRRSEALAAMGRAFRYNPGVKAAVLYLLALGPSGLTRRMLARARATLRRLRRT